MNFFLMKNVRVCKKKRSKIFDVVFLNKKLLKLMEKNIEILCKIFMILIFSCLNFFFFKLKIFNMSKHHGTVIKFGALFSAKTYRKHPSPIFRLGANI